MAEDKMPALRAVDSDGHERRLQNLEGTVGDMKADVAENKLTLGFITEKVQASFDGFASKLDAGFDNITKRLDEGENRMNAMGERIGEHGRKFEALADEKRKSAEKWDSWKKYLATAVTGAVAIGLKELVSFIVRHL